MLLSSFGRRCQRNKVSVVYSTLAETSLEVLSDQYFGGEGEEELRHTAVSNIPESPRISKREDFQSCCAGHRFQTQTLACLYGTSLPLAESLPFSSSCKGASGQPSLPRQQDALSIAPHSTYPHKTAGIRASGPAQNAKSNK